jgi:hypothetical protein
VAGQTKRWVANVIIYTLAGVASSALIGALLGLLGQWLLGALPVVAGLLVAIAVALVAIARETGLLYFKLPQLGRQTKDYWAKMFPGPVVAALWGFDLGLIFTTWLTFSGVWLLALVAFVTHNPAYGAALFVAYWFGRALSVWIAPLLMSDANSTPFLINLLLVQRRVFHNLHVLGLTLGFFILAAWLLASLTL